MKFSTKHLFNKYVPQTFLKYLVKIGATAEVYSGLPQTSLMECFATIVIKLSIFDVYRSPGYASELGYYSDYFISKWVVKCD